MLTRRQFEIAGLAARGLSNKAIAKEVGLSVPTVRDHISDAAAKLPGDVPARRRLMVWFLSLEDDRGAA